LAKDTDLGFIERIGEGEKTAPGYWLLRSGRGRMDVRGRNGYTGTGEWGRGGHCTRVMTVREATYKMSWVFVCEQGIEDQRPEHSSTPGGISKVCG